MKRKGMIYTSFALLASVLLVSVAILSVQTDNTDNTVDGMRIGQASFFMDSVIDDLDRSLSMASRRMLTSSTNYVITENEPLINPSANLSSALVNGTISGNPLNGMENVSMEAWTVKVRDIAASSGYQLNTSLRDRGFNSTNLDLEASYTVFARMRDPVTLAAFNRTGTANTTVPVEGIEDPMISLRSNGNYISNYEKCGFDDPADIVSTGSTSDGMAYGKAVVNPSNPSSVDSASEKIIVVDDVDSYTVSEVNSFEGAVSASSNSSSGYTNSYSFDTGSISGIETNQTVLIKDGDVWDTRFETMFKSQCYIDDDVGPDVVDRLQNHLVNKDGSGTATLLDLSELPTSLRKEGSAVAYVYFNESASYGGIEEIEGISDEYSWFRLDQDHIDEWGINDLVK